MKYSILGIILICFVSCEIEQDLFEPILPAYSETGEGLTGAKLNDQAWLFDYTFGVWPIFTGSGDGLELTIKYGPAQNGLDTLLVSLFGSTSAIDSSGVSSIRRLMFKLPMDLDGTLPGLILDLEGQSFVVDSSYGLMFLDGTEGFAPFANGEGVIHFNRVRRNSGGYVISGTFAAYGRYNGTDYSFTHGRYDHSNVPVYF